MLGNNHIIVKLVCPLRFAQLLVQVESLMGERMELQRKVILLDQNLKATAASAAQRYWLENQVVCLQQQLHAAKAAAASVSHRCQMTGEVSTSQSQVQVLW